MGEKKQPRLTPEENEKRQAARAEKRQQGKDAQTIALMIAPLRTSLLPSLYSDEYLIERAYRILLLAKERVKHV